MYTRSDLRADLLATAQQTSEDAAYLIGFPTNNKVITQLLNSATRIGEIARARGLSELAELSDRLAANARSDQTDRS